MKAVLRVLIVEDSVLDAELLVAALQQLGVEIQWLQVQTAIELNEALSDREWNLVLADDSMPHFDGLTALAMVKSVLEDVPFILVSGSISEAIAASAIEAGADHFVRKGQWDKLLEVIKGELKKTETRAGQQS